MQTSLLPSPPSLEQKANFHRTINELQNLIGYDNKEQFAIDAEAVAENIIIVHSKAQVKPGFILCLNMFLTRDLLKLGKKATVPDSKLLVFTKLELEKLTSANLDRVSSLKEVYYVSNSPIKYIMRLP